MFDGLFKPKFYTKCKSVVKATKTRVEGVKRKKNAVCKYLKKDIADLLKNRLDHNAYGRVEGLLEEEKRLRCYELLEQFCSCVGSNVSLLHKTTGCPEECREAVSSLIYAAARVSEVPELRDVRHLFADRYGTSLEHFVSQELVDKFKVEPPSKQMKLQLMHEIAREYSVEWDSKSLEQRLYTPPPPQHPSAQGNHVSSEEAEGHNPEEEKAKPNGTETRESSDGESKDRFTPAPHLSPTPENNTESRVGEKPKPRSVRSRFPKATPDEASLYPLKPPPASSSQSLRSDSMDKGGVSSRRLSRRTISWQPAASNDLPDFDEVAARVDALRPK
ncbi:PREDICTED: uncharacterized protein LOC104812521 isoform X2 [Tarenaya hassleriana]|uniref:uncharacterized protein LOC104812521 isoform X2 n=1 Tax=Tarenaya hassleriana TaxID=28532 RepID=UPI00053C5030|nr:PREDICTED: uncharacterized protein LOC104812521 isoform X2 [Tarenaya hassleriana]